MQSNTLFYLKDILSSTATVWSTFRISWDLELWGSIETGWLETFMVFKNWTQIERLLVTATGWVATIVKRGLQQDWSTANVLLQKSWNDGTIGYITVKPDDFIATAKLDTAGGLRNTMGNALWMFEVTPSWVEVKRWITIWSGVPADTALIQYTDPTTREKSETTYSAIKNSLASAWKYVQNIPAWESISSWDPTSIAIIWLPIIYSNTLGSNVAWNRLKSGIRFLCPYNTTIGRVKTSQLSNSSSARVELYQDDWTTLISSQPKKPDDINFIPTLTADIQSWYTLTTDCPDSAYKAFDNNAWTNLYTWNVNWRYVKVMMPAKKRANRVTLAAWAGASQTIASATVYWVSSTGVETLLTTTWVISRSAANFDFVNDIEYQWFKVVFWAPSGSYSGSYEIVSVNFTQIETADTFDFSNISITWNTIYRLFVNDSAFFNGQNNELALSSYQSNFPFCISWTLNGTNTVEPQNIKEIQLWTKKAMKAVANSSDEYAILAWFITWPKNKWDLLELNANDWTLVSWFSWLTPLSKYYVSNTSWVISTTAWTISRIVWMAVSPTELYISSSYYPWTNVTKP